MQFAILTQTLLLQLKSKGYNLLTSKNTVDDENPTWYPEKVDDVWEYIVDLDSEGKFVPLQEPAILVIDDAIKNIEDWQLIGEVFIEEDHQQKLQQRLFVYNEHYQFAKDLDRFDYAYDPQRVLLRNHALHSGDQSLYLKYLSVQYPEHLIAGIQNLEYLTQRLICLDRAQARKWMTAKRVEVLESDISIFDQDAILKIVDPYEQVPSISTDKPTDSLIYNQMAAEDILALRDIFWIDPRMG
ncbi:hypothetical protein ACFX5U_09550 [Sphingobacterium sp. SG20118]|uniref:hypothetical protein n=1 Tax=Sphingobacterium sp. SG20118 TaxID=3367156 RepID=UPI0037DFC07A